MTLESMFHVNESADADRGANGRFKSGNRGGPGNPNGGKLAQFRQIVIDSATIEDMRAIAKKLREMALEGHWQAMKLFLLYTCGKPGSAFEVFDTYEPPVDNVAPPSPNGELLAGCANAGPHNPAPPSPNGDSFAARAGDVPHQQTPPSPNGDLQEATPSPNGDFSPPLNRQQRRALRKAYRLGKQKRNTPTPVMQAPPA